MDATRKRWTKEVNDALAGQVIRSVRYMTPAEVEDHDFSSAAVVIQFEDGGYLIPVSDDEGNDAGAMFAGHFGELVTIPVI
jgi:hypothetical protein